VGRVTGALTDALRTSPGHPLASLYCLRPFRRQGHPRLLLRLRQAPGDAAVALRSWCLSLTAVTASLATNTSTGEGSDTLLAVENLLGSSKADTLTGSGANNKLTGGGGPDTEQGGSGNDQVIGSGGADTLKGEDGDDAVNSKDNVSGNDSLDGGAGTDTKVTDTTEKSIVNFP
jgi:Ca2+-binding RTX toxin-like protein